MPELCEIVEVSVRLQLLYYINYSNTVAGQDYMGVWSAGGYSHVTSRPPI